MGRWLVEKVTSCRTTICLIPHECLSCLEYFSLNSHLHKILAPCALLLTSCLSFKDLPTTMVSSFSQLSWEIWGGHSSRLRAVSGTSSHWLPSCGLLSIPDEKPNLQSHLSSSPQNLAQCSVFMDAQSIFLKIFYFIYLFWLCQVLVAAHRIFHLPCGMWDL